MKRPPASVLMESLPSVLREATVNLGSLDCSLGGEPYFTLGVLLASTGATMMVLKPLDRPVKPGDSLGRVKITITHNPQVGDGTLATSVLALPSNALCSVLREHLTHGARGFHTPLARPHRAPLFFPFCSLHRAPRSTGRRRGGG